MIDDFGSKFRELVQPIWEAQAAALKTATLMGNDG